MTFAFSRDALIQFRHSRFPNPITKFRFDESLFDLPQERATRSAMELALMLRSLDDSGDMPERIHNRVLGTLYDAEDNESMLFVRDVANKIIHCSAINWDFSDPRNPLIICDAAANQKRFKWVKAVVRAAELGSLCLHLQHKLNPFDKSESIVATAELDGRRQDILWGLLPGLRRMAALADSHVATDTKLNALQEMAGAHNIELSIHRIATSEEIAAAIDLASSWGAKALNILASPMLYANRHLIMDRVARLRLPAISQWPEMAEEGGFAAYGPRLTQVPKFAARPAIEKPTKNELVINLKTAKTLRLSVPKAVLAIADKVIK